MAFAVGRRRGHIFDDTLRIGQVIKDADFNVSGKGEREFEIQLSQILKAEERSLSTHIVSQYNNDGQVASSYFFGKKHRPDMSIEEYGTAIELKYINKDLNGIKNAIAQGLIYRLRFKFAVLVLVVAKEHQELYEEAYLGHESDLDGLLNNIAEEMNIFSILKPAFKPRKGLGSVISYFPEKH